MAASRNRRHIFVPAPRSESFAAHPRKITPKPVPPSSVAAVRGMRQSVIAAVHSAKSQRATSGLSITGTTPGTYLEFQSKPDATLPPLGNARRRIELVASREDPAPGMTGSRIQRATVFVPPTKEEHFLNKFDAFTNATGVEHEDRPSRRFVDPVEALGLAAIRALWTDPIEQFPNLDEVVWWEVWLLGRGEDALAPWMEFTQAAGIDTHPSRLEFGDRLVTLTKASARQLEPAMLVLDRMAELRAAKTLATFFIREGKKDQTIWAENLATRVSSPPTEAPAVCVLDTGINHAHPLLEGFIDGADCHTCRPSWLTDDHDGHGTEMAGVALYGDLIRSLESNAPIRVRNRLESVKLLPRAGDNNPKLWASLTAEATSTVEIEAPDRARTFLMAVTADGSDRGMPSSWSAAVDALSAGRAFIPEGSRLEYLEDSDSREDISRLFIISAGNVPQPTVEHLDTCDTSPIQDPAQAWNALSVGAYTDKVDIDEDEGTGWVPVATEGELSPWSTTSMDFARQWPIKPEVVSEGGNAIYNSAGQIDARSDVSLLTTYFRPNLGLFVETLGTSPAAAEVARIATATMAEYPTLWPQTIRALVVHSAEWTAKMRQQIDGASGKRAKTQLLRRYGFGVPSLDRALRSAGDALTLVAQESVQPFMNGKLGHVHLYTLPWPRDELMRLGEANVQLRVTLSYFVEPSPGRRGSEGRYQYSSHGLRFELNEPNEPNKTFHKRVNSKALAEGEKRPKRSSPGTDWYFGEARDVGSLHADMLDTTAAELAERNLIAVYPVGGWWKHRPKEDRSQHGVRYALVVSLKTDAIDADLWTPVANALRVPTTIEVEV